MGGLPQGSADNIPADENFAAIPVKVNGINSSYLGLYSQSFEAGFSSLVFGGEFNIYFNPIVPKEYGLLIRPMVGFRYLGIQEEFDRRGLEPGRNDARSSREPSTTFTVRRSAFGSNS